MLSPFSIVSNTVKKVDVIKSQISWEPNLWSFWMAGRQSPGATCLSNVRRGVSGHLFSLPTYTASEPRTWRQDAMALRLHVVAIPRDDQGTLLNISHNTFVESKFLVRSRKFTQNPPHWRSRLSTLGEHWCHMTWSRLLGGTWVLIWWIWELTESTQQKPLSKCNCLLCMVLPNAASQSIISIAVHPIGPSMPCG